MADISAWSPVDESNTAAPPNGWPENMQASAVNNSARALMGGVRRWYDTITPQITDLYNKFTLYLPLSGGTLTGNLLGTTIGAAQLTSSGNVNAGGSVAATLDVTANRNMSCLGLSATSVAAAGTITTLHLTATGTVQGAYVRSTGNIDATGTIGAAALVSSGNINAANIGASGNISATGAIAAGSTLSSATTVQGAYVRSTGELRADTNLTTGLDIVAGRNLYGNVNGAVAGDWQVGGRITLNTCTIGGELKTTNWIIPGADNTANVGLPGLNFNAMFAYAFVVPSDERLKDDIENAEGGLALVRAVAVKTYSLPAAPDPDRRHWGLLAQEVAEAARGRDFGGHVVGHGGEEGLAVNELVAVLWGACREMAQRIETLEEAAHAR